MSDTGSPIFLGRQPILDRRQQLVAYELLFRSAGGEAANRAEIADPTQATATVIANAFAELSTGDALGPYRGYINVDRELLFSELIEVLPPSRVVLEICPSVVPDADVVARCTRLRELGFTLAADDLVDTEESHRPLLSCVEIVKADVGRLGAEALRSLVGRLRPLGKTLLAERLESDGQVAICRELDFDLYQGYFFARPSVIVGHKLNPSQLALMRLLGLILEDADTSRLENAFKLEPGLAVNLLRLTNSVSCGLAVRVTSLRHAITILGRKQLQRWLQLLLYTGSGQGDDHPLLQLAATRGRLMELLSARLQPRNNEFAEQAFMVGIMSLMPALLGIAIADLVAQLPVAPRVRQALVEHEGPHGLLLRAVECTEHDDPQAVGEALQHLPGITEAFLETCLGQALAWANHLGQEQADGD